jgi:hypothetical protein
MLIHEFIAVKREKVQCEITYSAVKKRQCVRIADNLILNNGDFLSLFRTHWEYIGNVHEGLNYHGITIILNEDLPQFISVLSKYNEHDDIQQLTRLCKSAFLTKKDIVHFGI